MFGFGFAEIVLITAIALIVIGPKRLPGVARALGKGFSEFKGALDDIQRSVYTDVQKPMDVAKNSFLDDMMAERARERKPGPPPEMEVDLGEPEVASEPPAGEEAQGKADGQVQEEAPEKEEKKSDDER